MDNLKKAQRIRFLQEKLAKLVKFTLLSFP